MTAQELKNLSVARVKVNAWLDHIQEFDTDCRNEVIDSCTDGGEITYAGGRVEKLSAKSFQDYYVARYMEDCYA